MAIVSADFHIPSAEVDSRIDTLIDDITSGIEDIVTHLDQDPTTQYVSINRGESASFSKKLKVLEGQFKWYKDLAGQSKVFLLKSAFADASNEDPKQLFVLDKIFTSNTD